MHNYYDEYREFMEKYIVRIERDFDHWGNANVMVEYKGGSNTPLLNQIVGKNLIDKVNESDLEKIMNFYEGTTQTGLIKLKHCLSCPEKVTAYMTIINKKEEQLFKIAEEKYKAIDELKTLIKIFIKSGEGYYFHRNMIVQTERDLSSYIDTNSFFYNDISRTALTEKEEIIYIFDEELEYIHSNTLKNIKKEIRQFKDFLKLNNIKEEK